MSAFVWVTLGYAVGLTVLWGYAAVVGLACLKEHRRRRS
jgi:hypothetical protein